MSIDIRDAYINVFNAANAAHATVDPPSTDDPRDLSDPPIRIDDSFGSGGSSKDRRRARRKTVQETIMQLDRDAESGDSVASKTAVRPVTADDIRDNAILVRLLPPVIPWPNNVELLIVPLTEWRKEVWDPVARMLRHRNMHGGYFFGVDDSDDRSGWWVTSVHNWADNLKRRFEDAREEARKIREHFREEWKDTGVVDRWEEHLYLDWELRTIDDPPTPPSDTWQAIFWHVVGKSKNISEPTLRAHVQTLLKRENAERDAITREEEERDRMIAEHSRSIEREGDGGLPRGSDDNIIWEDRSAARKYPPPSSPPWATTSAEEINKQILDVMKRINVKP